MKPFLVLGGGEGAQNLASALKGKAMTPLQIGNRRERTLHFKKFFVVNWGWSTWWAHINRLGKKDRWVKDKARASHEFRNAGVNCSVYMTPAEARKCGELPLLRRKARHSKGRDIKLIKKATEIVNGYWYVKMFNKEREYRVHLAFGKVVKLQRKRPTNKTDLVWSNEDANFERVKMDNPSYKPIIDEAIKAVNVLGLDCGAVDIGVINFKKSKQKINVFEVNTAPSLNEDTAQRYADAIRKEVAKA